MNGGMEGKGEGGKGARKSVIILHIKFGLIEMNENINKTVSIKNKSILNDFTYFLNFELF